MGKVTNSLGFWLFLVTSSLYVHTLTRSVSKGFFFGNVACLRVDARARLGFKVKISLGFEILQYKCQIK